MKNRAKRLTIALAILVLSGIVALAVLEWDRRRHVTAGTLEDGNGVAVSTREEQEKYRNPEAFARLCAEIQERYDALQQRYLRLWHTRKTRQTSYDKKGKAIAVSESVSRVHFVKGAERKEEIEHRQVMGKPSIFDPDRINLEREDTHLLPPFSKDSPADLYRYHLEGIEDVEGRRLLRIHFEPSKPIERSFTGSAWIDPDTQEPVRIRGSLAKAKLSVDHFDLLLDYGPSENGHNQLRRLVMDMAGGFALLSLHYRIDSELSDYRESNE
jgi:hypothetical protein